MGVKCRLRRIIAVSASQERIAATRCWRSNPTLRERNFLDSGCGGHQQTSVNKRWRVPLRLSQSELSSAVRGLRLSVISLHVRGGNRLLPICSLKIPGHWLPTLLEQLSISRSSEYL